MNWQWIVTGEPVTNCHGLFLGTIAGRKLQKVEDLTEKRQKIDLQIVSRWVKNSHLKFMGLTEIELYINLI